MPLRFIGIDPNTNGDECPTVWADDTTAELIVQGWKVDQATHTECLSSGNIPETEAVVRIPARMVPIVRKACDASDRAQLR